MHENLYRSRMNEDVERRAYYGKFIFNSHFLIFLTIAAGFFLYSLLGVLQTLEPSLWQDMIAALLVTTLIMPGYRSLLKQADGLFLLPYESRTRKYFRNADRYSLTLGIPRAVIGTAVAVLILTVGHGPLEIVAFVLVAAIFYYMNFHIRKDMVNSDVHNIGGTAATGGVNFLFLLLVLMNMLWAIPAVLIMYMLKRSMDQKAHSLLDWYTLIEHEDKQLNRYYRNVSLFTNVSHIDKQFKRRRFLDPLLWQPKGKSFGKERMYEFLFYRTFARSHDLPMIILRLLLLFGIVMVWVGNLYLSIIIALFGVYIIVLQMSQIYTAQAYLLWPKVWPVDRSFIQYSYVSYSHKLVFLIAIIFSIIFIVVHPAYFYIGFLFPLWGYVINRMLSRTVYRKEKELSD